MKLTKNQIEDMQEDLTADMLGVLTEERNMKLQEAMLMLYNSDTFERLRNADSGLYYQSAGYLIDCLDNELTTGACW